MDSIFTLNVLNKMGIEIDRILYEKGFISVNDLMNIFISYIPDNITTQDAKNSMLSSKTMSNIFAEKFIGKCDKYEYIEKDNIIKLKNSKLN